MLTYDDICLHLMYICVTVIRKYVMSTYVGIVLKGYRHVDIYDGICLHLIYICKCAIRKYIRLTYAYICYLMSTYVGTFRHMSVRVDI